MGFPLLKREIPVFQHFNQKAMVCFTFKVWAPSSSVLYWPLKSGAARLFHEQCSNIGVQLFIAKHGTFDKYVRYWYFPVQSSTTCSVQKLILRLFFIENMCFKLWAPRKSSINWWPDEPIPGSLWLKEWQKYKNTRWFEKTSFGHRTSGAN